MSSPSSCFRWIPTACRRRLCQLVLSQFVLSQLLFGNGWPAATAWSAEFQLLLRLKDGSYATGDIAGVEQADHLGWQSPAFAAPFQFDAAAIRSITTAGENSPAAVEARASELGQLIQLSNGGLMVGQLRGLDESTLRLETAHLGMVHIDRQAVVSIADASYVGDVVYQGPLDERHWQSLTNPEDWEFQGGAVVANKQGAAIVGQVGLPTKAQINLSLSWRGTPDFVLSLGTQAENKNPRVDEVPSAARLEVWANQLALVREVEGAADIAMLADLSGAAPRIDLMIYLDQESGTIVVCDKHGRPMESLTVPSRNPLSRPAVQLVNSGPALSVEQFEIRQWDGVASTVTSDEPSIADSAGNHYEGAITGFDAEQRLLQLALANGEQQTVPLDELRRGDVAPFPAPPAPADTAAAAEPRGSADVASAATTVEVILADRSRLRGKFLASDDAEQLRMQVEGVADEVQFSCRLLTSLIGSEERPSPVGHGEQVVGTLKLEGTQLEGFLAETTADAPPESTHLQWHPLASRTASLLLPSAQGAIVYRPPLPITLSVTHEAAGLNVPREGNAVPRVLPAVLDAQARSGKTAAGETAGVPADTATDAAPVAREIAFRTGDAVDGVVTAIDGQGMTFHSNQTSTTHAPHELIRHIWLNPQHSTPEIAPEKLKRLMTVPRSMKNDPPTHLLVSVTGDFLRGRLLRLEGSQITVGVGLEEVQLATAQVAQIIWLHDRDWDSSAAASSSVDPPASAGEKTGRFAVHAVDRQDRGLTFHPLQLAGGTLSGTSDLLGECSIAVKDLSQLLFGPSISEQVRAFRSDPWTLSLAQLPRVYSEDPAAGEAGMNASLVGQPAEDFLLRSLTGEAFRLSKHRDRVVVLDFWASWCGPCMQTMPLVADAVQSMGADKVHLVAVNIQEGEARARAAIEKLQLDATVVLDIEGQVAASYQAQAIPQTVIIDRQGQVTHVFVGGGPRFVEPFYSALEAVVNAAPANP